MSQDSMTIRQTEVEQQLNGANTNTQQIANSQENSSSSSQENASNQKIQLDSSLKFVRNVVYKFPLKGGINFYRYYG